MSELYWLKRPIAHRGLHDAAKGTVENSASAVKAAMGAGYAIEVDLQCAAGHMPVVFHDKTLDRLTYETGPVIARDAEALCGLRLRNSEDRILSPSATRSDKRARAPRARGEGYWTREGKYEANIALLLASYPGRSP
jgi:glycerophosphoryl diester phosphodiesterase